MKVPHAYGLLREVPGHRQLNNANDQLYDEAYRSGQSVPTGDRRRSFGVFDMLNVPHSSIGAKYLKLKWRKFDHWGGHVGGARNIFIELFGHHKAENTFWLDSSSTEKVSDCSLASHY